MATWTLIVGSITNVAFLVEGYVGADLSRTMSLVSELGGRGEPAAMFFRMSDLVTGVLLFTGAACLWALLPSNRLLRAGIASSMVFALATGADAFLPLDCAPTVDAACRVAEAAGTVSWQHDAHSITGIVESITASAAMLLIAAGVWRAHRRGSLPDEWDALWQQLVVFGGIYAALSLVIAAMYVAEAGPIGTVQRVQIVIYAAGMFTLGLAARNIRVHGRLPARHGPTSATTSQEDRL